MGSIFVITAWWILGILDAHHVLSQTKPVTLNTFLRRWGFRGTEHYKNMHPVIRVLVVVFGMAGLFADDVTKKFIKGVK